MKKSNLIGIILLSIGLNGCALIALISWLLYGKVYFYDGYDYTGWLWTLCFVLIAAGFVSICIGSESKVIAKQQNKFSHFVSVSKGRFVLIGIAYSVLFIIFALCGSLAYWIIMTVLFAIGVFCYIYADYYKNSTFNPKTSSLEEKEKKKMHYSIVIAICLIVCLIMTLLCGLPGGGTSSGSGTCGVCGGSGTVTHKVLGEGSGVQKGFDTYYRCGSCHGTGTK